MNLLVALVLIGCLAASTTVSDSSFPGSSLAIADGDFTWRTRMWLVAAATLIAPLMAVVQTRFVSHQLPRLRHRPSAVMAMLRRMSIFHATIWVGGCFLIVVAMDWPALIAASEGFWNWPGIHEALLVTPVLVSLALSWAAFYDIEAATRAGAGRGARYLWRLNLRQRAFAVWVRFRVHVLMVLLPVWLLMTTGRLLQAMEVSQGTSLVAVAVVFGVITLVLAPWLSRRIWKMHPLADVTMEANLQRTCEQCGVTIGQFYRWDTGDQCINAAVTGVLMPWRAILLTDALLDRFEPQEVEAIVRHESGHVRLHHLPTKMLLVVLPMFALLVDQATPNGLTTVLANALASVPLENPGGVWTLFISFAFAGYLAAMLAWISRTMEFEADLFATEGDTKSPTQQEAVAVGDSTHCRSLMAALTRLAAHDPVQVDRRTFLHPSLRERLRLLASTEHQPDLAKAWRHRFAFRRVAILAVSVAALALSVIHRLACALP